MSRFSHATPLQLTSAPVFSSLVTPHEQVQHDLPARLVSPHCPLPPHPLVYSSQASLDVRQSEVEKTVPRYWVTFEAVGAGRPVEEAREADDDDARATDEDEARATEEDEARA
jgi:hypothetical protein